MSSDVETRLAVVEVKMDTLAERFGELDDKVDKRLEQLIELVVRPSLLERMLTGAGDVVSKNASEVIKLVVYIALGSGGAAAVKALWP
jgi:hypothetical protein